MRYLVLALLLVSSTVRAGEDAFDAEIDSGADKPTHALIDRWIAAQNHGDFPAYSALYAADFHGVRRSGARTVTLDRAAWLADRARMFKQPMTVAASEIAIVGAHVKLTQTFTQNKFKDVGPKQLVLVKSASGELQIAREEMMASTVAAPPSPITSIELRAMTNDGEIAYDGYSAGSCNNPPLRWRGLTVNVELSALPKSARVEFALREGKLGRDDDGVSICLDGEDDLSAADVATEPARAHTQHQFAAHSWPCSVHVTVRVLDGKKVLGARERRGAVGHCAE